MTAPEAQKIGSKKSIKATLVTLGVALFFLLLDETEGDFANGILFFFTAVLNGFFLLLLGSLLVLSFWLGRIAGKAILLKKYPFWVMGLSMMALSSIYILLYLSLLEYFNNEAAGPFLQRMMPAVIDTIKRLGGQVVLLQTCCWLWIGYSIQGSGKKAV